MDEILENAPRLDVYLYSEHPKVIKAVGFVVDELFKPARKERRKYWKTARMLITNLWESANASNNPWRSLSRDKSAYLEGTRYNKLYITYLLVKVVDRLIELGYIEQIKGKYNSATGFGRASRIKATEKLLELVRIRDIFSVLAPNPEDNSETIILKDKNKKLVDYKDFERTDTAREELRLINELLAKTKLEVSKKALKDTELVVLTRKKVFRVFNNDDFSAGGRVYGGFWQQIKREYRSTIKINGESVTELDYKANHPSMIYRLSTDKPIPSDCYTVNGFNRDIAKKAIMMMINNETKEAAVNALAPDIRKKLGIAFTKKDSKKVIESLEELHEPILPFLYDPKLGMTLQSIEGEIAVDILFTLMKEDIPCLPLHDSFIVAVTHRERLRAAMIYSYKKHINQEPIIDMKY